MANKVVFTGRPFHFIGIGGIGMSALAYILAKRNLPVSGSDIRSSHITQRLQSVGAHIFNTQEATNLDFCLPTPSSDSFATPPDSYSPLSSTESPSRLSTLSPSVTAQGRSPLLPQVICSTAISTSNTEYAAALEKGCPIFHRSDVLAALIQDYQSIAVAGTHGKTTTSSLIGYLLLQAGLDPTVVVGGEVNAWEGNARLGQSPFLVAEADESDGSLSKLSAMIGVITNIELDHPDHYQNLDEVVQIFEHFASQCETVVGCIDCETVRNKIQPQITYSLNPDSNADYSVQNVVYQAWGTTAEVLEQGKVLGTMRLPLLSQHNLSNALAAVAVGRALGLAFPVIAEGLTTFEGAKRRFEYRGEVNGIVLIDDYAHHPSEIRATLAAARLRVASSDNPMQRVVAIFQPHRYSRTKTFLEDFAVSFNDADLIVLTDIYSAGEANLQNITGQQVANAIAIHHPHVIYSPHLESLKTFLQELLQPGDLAVFLGAGNLNQIIPEMMES